MKKFIEKNLDTLLIIIGIIIFVLVNTYKLTNAGLWFDEGVEYWYSKGGTLPMGLSGSGGFFDRVRSTNQPPLYNMLMFLWLKIMDTEFWFRFFGVVAGAIGMIFLYKSCRLITKNRMVPLFVVVFTTFIFRQVYYYQEAAEYCLLMPLMHFCLYSFIKYIKDINLKNLIQMSISFILPLYTQYGSAFPVIVMGITALIITIKSKNIKDIKNMIISYGICAVAFGLPLYFLFFRYNVRNNQNFVPFNFHINFVYDILESITSVVLFHFTALNTRSGVVVYFVGILSVILIVLLMLFILFKGSNFAKIFVVIMVATFIFHYTFCKAGFYANSGWFDPNATNRCANRWSLFYTPLIIILMVILLNDFYIILQKVKFNNINIGHVFFGCVLTFVIMYSYVNFFYHIQYNWGKENIRGAVQYYVEDDKEKEGRVLVHVDSRHCFAFYMTHIGNQTVDDLDSDKYVICSATNLEKIKEQLAEFNINDNVIYLFGSHGYSDSVNKEYIKYFNERGYQEEIEPIGGVSCTEFIKK